MNHYKTDTNGALVDTAPLFASVWLALFNEIRKNFYERRLVAAAGTQSSQAAGKK